ALVTTAIEHLAKFGPVGVQPQEICAELGISKALVNYHFGGRDGLIAEAVTVAYERHSARAVELANRIDDGVSPAATLEALIEFQVQWGGDQPGLAAAITYPDIAVGRGAVSEQQQVRMADAGQRNFAALHRVLVATRSELSGGRGFADEMQEWQTAAIIGWITLGMLSWNGGMFLPMQRTGLQDEFDRTRQQLHTLIRDALSR
ncbi:MAG: hypothetical protein RL238_2065, partial [Actinomycetota bacterium]